MAILITLYSYILYTDMITKVKSCSNNYEQQLWINECAKHILQ